MERGRLSGRSEEKVISVFACCRTVDPVLSGCDPVAPLKSRSCSGSL